MLGYFIPSRGPPYTRSRGYIYPVWKGIIPEKYPVYTRGVYTHRGYIPTWYIPAGRVYTRRVYTHRVYTRGHRVFVPDFKFTMRSLKLPPQSQFWSVGHLGRPLRNLALSKTSSPLSHRTARLQRAMKNHGAKAKVTPVGLILSLGTKNLPYRFPNHHSRSPLQICLVSFALR